MPTMTKITSLTQAHATLCHGWNRLWSCENQAGNRQALAEERRHLREWLDAWERAFTEYLSYAMAVMAGDELTQCRVLKANHLTCVVLASDSPASASAHDFDVFEAEFRAIVDLAGAVLQARGRNNTPQSASTASPVESPVMGGLDVQSPIWVVLSRCSNAAIWERANRLSLQYQGR